MEINTSLQTPPQAPQAPLKALTSCYQDEDVAEWRFDFEKDFKDNPPLDLPDVDHSIDQVRAQEWVKSAPAKYQQAAETLLKYFWQLNKSEFLQLFEQNLGNFVKAIQDKPFVLTLDWRKSKSNYWMSQLAYYYLTSWKVTNFLLSVPSEITRSCPSVRDYLFVDDAIFSGFQMYESLSKIADSLTERAESDESIEFPINFHVVVTLISREAEARFATWPFAPKVNVFIYGTKDRLKDLEQIMEETEDTKEKKAIAETIDVFTSRYPYYSWLKIPDNTYELVLQRGYIPVEVPPEVKESQKRKYYEKNTLRYPFLNNCPTYPESPVHLNQGQDKDCFTPAYKSYYV